jgi:hypothetical protein
MSKSQQIRWKGGNQPLCPSCDGVELRRHGRIGIWQRVFLPWMGLYPWECGLCRRIYMLRQRSSGYVAPSAPLSPADEKAPQQPSTLHLASEPGVAGENRATGTSGFSPRSRSH